MGTCTLDEMRAAERARNDAAVTFAAFASGYYGEDVPAALASRLAAYRAAHAAIGEILGGES